ncbi:sugar ABC transporter substrate-binding protein [uncultured Stomatobaculum sp.]|jgi:hypothetical protein|nr:substrate-binding domain-containing protein [uncultured Stomatobaculum sp.]
MKRQTVVWIAAAAAAFAVLLPLFLVRTRYASEQAGRRARIAVLTRREADVGTSVLFAGMEKAAEDGKLVLNYVMVPEDADAEAELKLARQEIEDGAQALIIEPVASEGSGKMAEELSQRAVVVLLGERADTEAAGRFGSVSADNYAIGVALGREIRKGAAETGGSVALLPAAGSRGSVEQRRRGVLEALRGSGISLQEDAEGAAIIAGLEDSALTEALSYALTAKERPLVYGVGNSNRNLYGLDRGDIRAMIVINEFNMGYLAVAEAKKKLSSRLREMEQLRVGDTLVSRDNMYSAENQKLLFPLVR